MSTLRTNNIRPFSGNTITISGSVTISGSFITRDTVIEGNLTLRTGSLNLFSQTGSTVTGSLAVSGNFTTTGDTTLSGSVNISGSTTIHGNPVISGSLDVSGSITPNNSGTFNLGSNAKPWNQLVTNNGIAFSLSGTTNGTISISGSGPVIEASASSGVKINDILIIKPRATKPNTAETGSFIVYNGEPQFWDGVEWLATRPQPVSSPSPVGTASFSGSTTVIAGTNTTAYLTYGVNIIESGSASTSSYCYRLPATPREGKELTVINTSGCEIFIFPSMEDGDINGFVNGHFIIPPNNAPYTFLCYENPLPGGWTVINAPNGLTQIWDTGIVDIPAVNTAYKHETFISTNTHTTTNTTGPSPFNTTIAPVQWGITGTAPVNASAFVTPSSVWKKVINVTVYTNIIGTFKNQLVLGVTNDATLYCTTQGTTTVVPTPNGDANYQTFLTNTYNPWLSASFTVPSVYASWTGVGGTSVSYTPGAGALASVIPGTFVPGVGETNLASLTGLNQGVGSAGTCKLSVTFPSTNINTVINSQMIGRSYVGSFATVGGVVLDVYYGKNIGFNIFSKERIDGGKPRLKAKITTQLNQVLYSYN